jgi:hypothetical protein
LIVVASGAAVMIAFCVHQRRGFRLRRGGTSSDLIFGGVGLRKFELGSKQLARRTSIGKRAFFLPLSFLTHGIWV